MAKQIDLSGWFVVTKKGVVPDTAAPPRVARAPTTAELYGLKRLSNDGGGNCGMFVVESMAIL